MVDQGFFVFPNEPVIRLMLRKSDKWSTSLLFFTITLVPCDAAMARLQCFPGIQWSF